MSLLDRAILALSPERGLRRIKAKRAASVLMHYDVADGGRRTKSMRPRASDADAAGARRQRISWVARDMLRNSAIATRAQSVIVSNVVGDGIIPAIEGVREGARARFLELVRAHLDTTAIDADGRANLYGLQRQIMAAVVADGEALVRVRRRPSSWGLALPFQLQVLEADYLDETMDIAAPRGAEIRNGVEYDATGRRIAYHLWDHHPGSDHIANSRKSRRVSASEIIHVYRVDRPGQQRGVSWLAPVAMHVQDLGDYLDAQIVRQKIGACFAAFRVTPDPDPETNENEAVVPGKLAPGLISTLAPGEDVRFASPPPVDGLDAFMKGTLRAIAGGLGVTYEALSGDLSEVNFSSARMGRMEMDRNVSAWQWLTLAPQLLDPIGRLVLEAWRTVEPTRDLRRARVTWTPPARVIVDPSKEYAAMREAVRSGFRSWQATVRSLGYDPETVAAELAADAALFDGLGFTTESDPRRGAGAAPPAAQPNTVAPADD